MTWIIVAAVAGLAVGGGSVFAVTHNDKPVAPVVVADVSAQKQLGVKLGDQAVLNGRTVRVALIMNGYANSQLASVVLLRTLAVV